MRKLAALSLLILMMAGPALGGDRRETTRKLRHTLWPNDCPLRPRIDWARRLQDWRFERALRDLERELRAVRKGLERIEDMEREIRIRGLEADIERIRQQISLEQARDDSPMGRIRADNWGWRVPKPLLA